MSIKKGGAENGRYKANYKHFDGVRLCANGGKIGGLEKMKKFISILKKTLDIILFCLGFKGTETGKKAVDDGLCDFSGQGRDKYGR